MSSFSRNGELDPNRSYIVTCVGRKGSGKSIMALLLFQSYPYDRLILDVAGDDGPNGPEIHTFTGPVDEQPSTWPEHLRKDREQLTVRYVPDAASATYLEDMDHWVGLAFKRGNVGILVHEIQELAPSGRTPPATRRLLRMSRHQHISLFACGPRPVTADPLVLQQSDLVYIFKLPNPNDRKRVAETIGYDPAEIDDAVAELRPHECLRFDINEPEAEHGAEDLRLVHLPPLPEEDVAALKRWAKRGLPDQADDRRRELAERGQF